MKKSAKDQKKLMHTVGAYLSQPSLHKETLYFVTDDDIWSAPLSGGEAIRLTQHMGICTSPVPSPEGEWIAFNSTWKGSDDLYVMPSRGGEARRVTFKNSVKLLKWISEERLMIASNHEAPFRAMFAYELNLKDLNLKPLPLGYLTHYDFDQSGAALLVRNGGDPARWKRYRGGTAGQIWTRENFKNSFKRILSDIPSNLTDAQLFDKRVYFLSDHEGLGNIFSCDLDGSDLIQHSNSKEYYCRSLSHWRNQFVYQCGGDIYHYNLKSNKTQKIEIAVRSGFVQAQPSVKEAVHYPDFACINQDGSQFLAIARGHLFTSPSFGGSGLHHSNTDEKKYSMARILDANNSFVAVQTELFSDRVVIGKINETSVSEVAKGTEWGKIWSLRLSPNETEIAVTNNRGNLFILNLKTKKAKSVFKSPVGRVFDTSWSPCSRYLAFSCGINDRVEAIYIYDSKTLKTRMLLQPILNDFSPSFDPTGKYLYFISVREFHPTYGETHFSASFPKATGVYALCLNKKDKNPFENWSTKLTEPEKTEKNRVKAKNKPQEIKTEIDFEGLENRVYKAPLELGGHWKVMAVKNGFVVGQSGPRMYDPDSNIDWNTRADLSFFSLEDKKATVLQKKVDFVQVSKNLEKILIRTGDKFRIISSQTPPGENKGVEHKDGWVDLSRFRFQVNPCLEWRQIYGEAWALQKEHFWTPDMSKVQWQLVYKRYLPLLDKVKTRREFSDLLWEMQGELGTSHCYEYGGEYQRKSERQPIALLGGELSFQSKSNSMVIEKIYKGDSWNSQLRSPLLDAGVGLSIGDQIFDVDGINFSNAEEFYSLLTNKSRLNCNLLVSRKGLKSKERIELKTLASEKPVIYRDWVNKNREFVHRMSKHRVGYVHVPNMMVKGFSEFYRGYLTESLYDSLIVDVRFNGGGHVSQFLLTQLSQKVNAFVVSRYQKNYLNPNYAMRGPIVAITNEFAGSDGDIFSHNFKQMKIGPLIGVRTWGGVVGINGQYTLKDGTQTTQPEYSYYFRDVGFKVENYGTDPDIEVVQTPEGLGKGLDEQLERAILEALDLLEKNPAAQPDFVEFPNLSLPK